MPTKKKPTTKAPAKKKPGAKKPRPPRHPTWTGEPGAIWVVRTRRVKGCAWMPAEVVLQLYGEAPTRLDLCGWSTCLGDQSDLTREQWPTDRLQHNLLRLGEEWTEDYGEGWRLEIR